MADRKLSILITGDAKGAKKALGELETATGKAEAKTKKSSSGIKSNLATLGIGAALFGAAKAADESAKVMAQTEAVIKSTGNAANITADGVADLAGALSKKTGIDDEAIQSGSNLIATFTNIRNEAGKGNDVFDQTTKAALDMSVAMGTDMKSAAMQLGKALNDPTAGLTKLAKSGVQFTEQQKEQVKALQASGDMLGAQKIILAEVEKQFGGSAEAQATAMGKAQVAVDNLAESVGAVLMPAVSTAANGISFLADGLGALPQGLQTTIVLAGGAAVAYAKWGDSVTNLVSKLDPKKLDGFRLGLMGMTEAGAGAGAKLGGLLSTAAASPAAWGVAAVGAGALTIALIEMSDSSKQARANADDLLSSMQATGKSLSEVFDERLSKTLADVKGGFKLPDSGNAFKKWMEDAGVSASSLSDALLGTDKEYKAFVASLKEEIDPGKFTVVKGNLDKLREAGERTNRQQKDLTQTNKELGVGAEETAESTEVLTQATGGVATSFQDVKDKADGAASSLRDYYSATTDGLSNTIAFEASLDSFTAAVGENGRSLDITTEAGRQNQQNLIAMRDAAVQAAAGIFQQTGSSDAAAFALTGYSAQLANAARQAGYSEGEIAMMIAQMRLTPAEIRTNVYAETGGAVANITYVQRLLDRLRDKTIKIGVNMSLAAVEGSLGMRASGGPVSMGTPYLVGEEGPEIVTFPANGTVHDAQATRAMLSGGSSSVAGMAVAAGGNTIIKMYVQGSVVTEGQLVDTMRRGLNEAQRRNGKRPILPGVSG